MMECASRFPSGRRRTGGMALLDVMLTVVILSIVAGIGIPSMASALTDFRLTTAAATVITAVEYAQATAVTNGRTMRVHFDTTASEVEVLGATPSAAPVSVDGRLDEVVIETTVMARVENPVNRGTRYVVSLAEGKWQGDVRIAAVDFDGADFLEFDERGNPASGGAVTLQVGEHALVLTVDAQAGRITMP